MDGDLDKRLSFLWRTAQSYSHQSPQIAGHLMSRFTVLSKKLLPPTLGSFCCPHCSTPHTPHTSTQHTVGRKRLRSLRRRAKLKGHDIPCVNTPSSNTKRYILIHCKTCRQSFVMGSVNAASQSLQHSTPLRTPSQPPPLATPSSHNRNKRRRSSTLKSLLLESSRLQVKRNHDSLSPRLADFLTTV